MFFTGINMFCVSYLILTPIVGGGGKAKNAAVSILTLVVDADDQYYVKVVHVITPLLEKLTCHFGLVSHIYDIFSISFIIRRVPPFGIFVCLRSKVL